ncbi:MAG: S-layer homology domain-containing protein [Clostridia bacterium]|nr:S-layer homology domain-containing protein [Clostridia bacterium]
MSVIIALLLMLGVCCGAQAAPGGGETARLAEADGQSDEIYEESPAADTETPSDETAETSKVSASQSGPSSLSMKAGDKKSLSVKASGGSGRYVYEWESDGCVDIGASGGASNTVYARDAGEGSVKCTVSDENDPDNRDEASWDVSVTKSEKPVTVKLDKTKLTLGAGESASLTVSASGGSGNYEYKWSCGDTDILTLEGSGASIRIEAASDVKGGSYTVRVSVSATDTDTNTESRAVYCTVTVKGLEASFDISGNAAAGTPYAMSAMAANISKAFSQRFGRSISDSASVRFDAPGGAAGTLRLKSGDAAGAGSEYTFAQFKAMSFYANKRGTFSTGYSVTDGEDVMPGTITFVCSAKDGTDCTYDPQVTVTMGVKYHGTGISNAISKKWKSEFGKSLPDSAEVTFTKVGTVKYGMIYLSSEKRVQPGTAYSFADFREMYFDPIAVGTFTVPYRVTGDGNTMSGTINIKVRKAAVSATLEPTSITMPTYSSCNIYVSVKPSSAYHTVSWKSSNPATATVSGDKTSAVIRTTGTAGTAKITVTVTDKNDNVIHRTCTVKVKGSSDSTEYSPVLHTTVDVNRGAAETSDAMCSQFRDVYGIELNKKSAQIRFSSKGNNKVGILRFANGTAVLANTFYSFEDYAGMYIEPVAAGTFRIPYTLSFNNKELSGTVSVVIRAGKVKCALKLPDTNDYAFKTDVDGVNGASELLSAIQNEAGESWKSISFSKFSDDTGTLYKNSKREELTADTKISESGLNELYFVPNVKGVFSAPFTVYNSAGRKTASGTLRIIVGGTSAFSDVSEGDYYADAVSWALEQGVTTGTTNTTFSPGSTVTRAQAVTFLWRSRGEPRAEGENPFTDVASGRYYTEAVCWALEQGITTGTTETTFSPNKTLTQEQMITFLCRADGEEAGGENWSEEAMSWAEEKGLFGGLPDVPSPKRACPRSDVVYYLWNDAE